jgi:hypothetical protein
MKYKIENLEKQQEKERIFYKSQKYQKKKREHCHLERQMVPL